MTQRTTIALLLGSALLLPAADLPEILCLNPRVTNLVQLPGDGATLAKWWSSFACEGIRLATNKEGPESWQVTLSPDTPLGLGVIRVDSNRRAGVFRLALIDPIPTSTNRMSKQMAPDSDSVAIRPPVAIEGTLEGNDTHYLRLRLNGGESVSLEVVAQRLSYPLDSRLRVLDIQGRELARADDSAIAGSDAILQFRAPTSDDYWVALSDTRQPPSSPRRYRLRLGDFSLVPLQWLPSTQLVPGDLSSKPSHIFQGRAGSWAAPTNAFPLRLRGVSRPAASRDVVTFDAYKNQRFRLDIFDRRIGSAGDFTARIENDSGRVLSEADLSKAELPTLAWTAPQEGSYRVVIEEVTGAGGPGYDYQMEMKPGKGDFLLHLTDALLEGKPGATNELKLKVQRRNYDGPLKLSVHGAPVDLPIDGLEVAAKTNDVVLKLSIPTDFSPGTWMVLGVTGEAEIDGQRVQIQADTRTPLKKLWPELNDPPPALDGLVWLWVGAKPATE